MGFPLEPQLDSICVGGQGRPVQKIKKKRGGRLESLVNWGVSPRGAVYPT